jgi:hypothetical protein
VGEVYADVQLAVGGLVDQGLCRVGLLVWHFCQSVVLTVKKSDHGGEPGDAGKGEDGARVVDYLWKMVCLQPHFKFHFL